MLHKPMSYPLFFLDPAIEGKSDGAGRRWWKRILHQLLRDYPETVLAKALLCVGYFPYRSHSFRSIRGYVESQEYGFDLVRQALRRRAMVIMMRSEKLWFKLSQSLNIIGFYFDRALEGRPYLKAISRRDFAFFVPQSNEPLNSAGMPSRPNVQC